MGSLDLGYWIRPRTDKDTPYRRGASSEEQRKQAMEFTLRKRKRKTHPVDGYLVEWEERIKSKEVQKEAEERCDEATSQKKRSLPILELDENGLWHLGENIFLQCEDCGRLASVPEHIGFSPSMTAYSWNGQGEDPNADRLHCRFCAKDYYDYMEEKWEEFYGTLL